MPGALAESVRCTDGGRAGRRARRRPPVRARRPVRRRVAGRPDRSARRCVLSWSTSARWPTVGRRAGGADNSAAARRAAARAADARLAKVVAARPERSLIIVAGVSDTDADQRLHVVIAQGPG